MLRLMTPSLLAVNAKESGAWLRALPVASIGTLLDDNGLRITVALRLGTPVYRSHQCVCAASADPRGYHGLSCRFSADRHLRHTAINSVIKRALYSAGFQSQLEPTGISVQMARDRMESHLPLGPWANVSAGTPLWSAHSRSHTCRRPSPMLALLH